jgi:hypothetical protein
MAEENGGVDVLSYKIQGQEARNKLNQVKIDYGKRLHELYREREHDTRAAEESLKDFVISF